ncbi:MAG: hypothetical protein WCG63_05200 [Opitutaceae bacterium]|jgi:hypothetical protein
MRHRLSFILTLTAWLLATGSHWDLVQTFGWGRMIATYSQSMSLSQAVKKTFSAGETCGVCDAVATAKQQDATRTSTPTAPVKFFGKIHLVFAPDSTPAQLILPVVFPWSPSDQTVPTATRAAPPLPPPRALA